MVMMTSHRLLMFIYALLMLFTLSDIAAARAVNISNTWMLPEEDFPVFYRYFRDRISWYEADAVCQFHHANLVTADTSSQYDAIRAYLKELDIIDNVWIGLSKKTENSDFTWSDSRILSGEGHWREPAPIASEPLCVTMDPTADFLWKPFSCGGPESASFICELQVPSWALGQKGCLLTELPSLTVLYIPEQMALELTSDCGLDGTKRITCKGNADREEIRKQLTCAISNEDFDDKGGSSKFSPSESPITVTGDSFEIIYTEDTSGEFRTPRSWASTSITVDGYEMSTRHRRETENTDASDYYRRSDVTEPVQASQASTRVYDDVEVTTMDVKENFSVTSESEFNTTNNSIKPSNLIQIVVTPQYSHTQHEDTTMVANDNVLSEVKLGVPSELSSEDVAEYPSVINQGQLFSIIENGTMFDIIELNDTASEDAKPTKIPVDTATRDNTSKNPDILSTVPVSSTQSENKNSFTTVVYLKEPPPDSTQVTNKSPKKFDRQFKTKYYKKSDPKKINYQSEKDQRQKKEKEYNTQNVNQAEIDKALNKEVEMFPVIAPGGPLVKLNRTHRKELPVMDENEKDFFDLNNENPDFTSDIDEDNELGFIEQHKHIEIKLGKKDDSNASDIFIVTTKFIDEHLGKKNTSHNESTTTFSENHNETFHDKLKTTQEVSQKSPPTATTSTSIEADINKLTIKSTATDIVIDSKLDDLNKNVSQNNESDLLLTLAEVEKVDKTDNIPWEKDEIMSKSLLGEIETITDDVIENNTSELKNPTSEPLNSEPITPGRPNRRRKLSNSQRRSFYPYFFSRVLG